MYQGKTASRLPREGVNDNAGRTGKKNKGVQSNGTCSPCFFSFIAMSL